MKILATNKKAYFDYTVLEKIECGISLLGWEVKAIKESRSSIKGSFVKEKFGELYIVGAQISSVKATFNKDKNAELRDRKLLLKKREIVNLVAKVKEKGVTLIPLDLYTNDKGLVKVTLGVCKGKKKFDKREALRKKDRERDIQTERKHYNF